MRHGRWLLLSAAAVVGLPLAQANGITIKSQDANVQITLNLPYSQVEDPALGQSIGGCHVIEWLDADYVNGGYKDWIDIGSGTPDGHPNEVWLRGADYALETTTTVDSTSVAIHLVGDNNDGLAEIFVDGVSVAVLDMQSPSPPSDTAVILVTGLSFGTHIIEVHDNGNDPASSFGRDVAILGASVCEGTQELFPKWRQPPHPRDEGFNVPSWLDWPSFLNQVVADDFCSDGRVITHVRWWGSYIEPFFEPICGPTPDALGCKPVPCPDPLQACVPVAVEWDPESGESRVVECECRDPGGCQVLVTQGEEPVCIGTCPPGFFCERTTEPLPNGWILYRCNCVPMGFGALGPGTGACCLPGGSCDDTIDENECLVSEGIWIPGVDCTQQPCDQSGACCVDDACIGDFSLGGCLESGGQWYFGETCESFICPTEPQAEIDGWLISFHSDRPASQNPPEFYSQPEDLLGLYFAPRDAVTIEPLGYAGWDGHLVYEYFVALEATCLLHSSEDPRTGTFPAQDGRFEEVQNVIYWIDIQAVTGHTWLPPECFGENTGSFFEFPFWGWHTSPEFWNDVSVSGVVVMIAPDEWRYEEWIPVNGDPHNLEEVHQAFVLMTPEEPLCFCRADITGPCGPGIPDGNVDALDFLLLIAQWGSPGPEADITGPGGVPDNIVDALDYLLLIAQWGSPGNCPDDCPTPE